MREVEPSQIICMNGQIIRMNCTLASLTLVFVWLEITTTYT